LGAGLSHNVHQAAHGVAIGHEIVDDENTVILAEPLLRHQQRHLFLIRIGENFTLDQAAFDVVALGLLGKQHGNAVPLGTHGGQCDTAGFGGQHHRGLTGIEILSKFVRDIAQQLGVYPVVQKTVDLDDITRQHLALAADAFL